MDTHYTERQIDIQRGRWIYRGIDRYTERQMDIQRD
jgi:hypothetical protein